NRKRARRASRRLSHEEEVASVQRGELHMLEHKLIVAVKVDDYVVALLVAVGLQRAEAREKCRHVDDIAARGAGRKIRDVRRAGTVLDANEIIAVAEKKVASKGPTFAKNERVGAGAQIDISHNATVIDHGLLAGTTENRNGSSPDEAG